MEQAEAHRSPLNRVSYIGGRKQGPRHSNKEKETEATTPHITGEGNRSNDTS